MINLKRTISILSVASCVAVGSVAYAINDIGDQYRDDNNNHYTGPNAAAHYNIDGERLDTDTLHTDVRYDNTRKEMSMDDSSHCVVASMMDTDELQRWRVRNPGMETCFKSSSM